MPWIKRIRITTAKFRAFCELRQKHLWDWPAVFSLNANGDLWGWRTFGPTPEQEREDVSGCSPLLDQVAGIYSVQREECGRFFIDQRGAFFKPEVGAEVQFVQWDSGGEKLQAPTPAQPQSSAVPVMLTFEQLRERAKSWPNKKKPAD